MIARGYQLGMSAAILREGTNVVMDESSGKTHVLRITHFNVTVSRNYSETDQVCAR